MATSECFLSSPNLDFSWIEVSDAYASICGYIELE